MPDDARPLDNPRAVPGHNRPPLDVFYKEQNEGLPGYLRDDSADLVARAAELIATFERMPDTISDEETAGKFSDQIAQFTALIKAAEAKRVDLKAGPLLAGRLIDGFFATQFFNKIGHPTNGGGIKAKALAVLTIWERKKADEERRVREEAERKAREAAEAAARAAAEEARRKAAAEESERKAREAAERAAAEAKDFEAAAAVAAQSLEDEDRTAKERAERDAAARAAAEEAERKRVEAEQAAKAAAAPKARLSTVRGTYGSSSSLRSVWKGRIKDYAAVDIVALRDFIPRDALDKAANAYAKIHRDTNKVEGVEFYEDTNAVVRG